MKVSQILQVGSHRRWSATQQYCGCGTIKQLQVGAISALWRRGDLSNTSTPRSRSNLSTNYYHFASGWRTRSFHSTTTWNCASKFDSDNPSVEINVTEQATCEINNNNFIEVGGVEQGVVVGGVEQGVAGGVEQGVVVRGVEQGVVGVEQSFSNVELGGHSLIGFLQNGLEFTHSTLPLPWWSCIACVAILTRLCLLPLTIYGRKHSHRLAALQPEKNRIEADMREAVRTRDTNGQLKSHVELTDFLKKNNYYSLQLKTFLKPAIQLPLFVSFLITLRQMSNTPSLKNEGTLWFPDLSVPDPLFVLPVLCTVSALVLVEVGEDGAVPRKTKLVIRTMLCASLLLTHSFPAALCVFWMTNNLFSLVRIFVVRNTSYHNVAVAPHVPPHVPHFEVQSGGFVANVKAGYKVVGTVRQQEHEMMMEEEVIRQRNNEEMFQKALRTKGD